MTLTLNTNSWGLHTFGFGPHGYFTLEAAVRKKMRDFITPEILAGAKSIREGKTPSNMSTVVHAQNEVQILHFQKPNLSQQNTIVRCIEKLWALVRVLVSFIFPDPIEQLLTPFPDRSKTVPLLFPSTFPPTAQTNSFPPTAPSATAPATSAQTLQS